MRIEVKGKVEALQDLEKARKLIDEAGKILYHLPNKIEFEVSGTEKGEIGEINAQSAPDNQ